MITIPRDDVAAFVAPPSLLAAGRVGGPLDGARLAVKDLFDVAGTVTGAGNPTYAEGRPAATGHATAVQRLLDAGASVIGKTITDELAFSLSGTNVHFGMPRNVNAPGRVPGGSSAGSAAAVAAGLADLALGTDTGGSVRIPASYCGIYGWRPTHGAVPIDRVVPLAPSFDVVGLFAPDPAMLAHGADALLGPDADRTDWSPPRVHLSLVAELLRDATDAVAVTTVQSGRRLGAEATVELGVDLDAAVTAFRHLQGRESWTAHGEWITAARPQLGRGVAARFAAAALVTDEEVAEANAVRALVRAAVCDATRDGTVLVIPGAAGAAPLPDATPDAHQAHRVRTLRLTCIAGLAGAPVVVAPLVEVDGLPLGIGFLGACGSDRALLALVHDLVEDSS
jgi:amidase